MSGQKHRKVGGVPGRWNRVFEALASEPRRRLLFALSRVPVGEGIPLPGAVLGSEERMSADQFGLTLRHVHLPKLAESGYVRWERDPLRAYRGPNFEEVHAVGRIIVNAGSELPPPLRSACGLAPVE